MDGRPVASITRNGEAGNRPHMMAGPISWHRWQGPKLPQKQGKLEGCCKLAKKPTHTVHRPPTANSWEAQEEAS